MEIKMMKKIRDLDLAELLYFEDKNKSLMEQVGMLKRAVEGMHVIIKTHGYEMADRVWKISMPQLPDGLLNLPYIVG